MERVPPGYTVSLRAPALTRKRMGLALGVALLADGLQLAMGPLGGVGPDQGIDLVAGLLTMWLLGFHPLLLPTFIIELIPIAELLPTWTGCVLLVIALRRRNQNAPPPAPMVGGSVPSPLKDTRDQELPASIKLIGSRKEGDPPSFNA